MTAVLEMAPSRSLFDDLIEMDASDEPLVVRRVDVRAPGRSFTRELRRLVAGAIVTVAVATVALVALAGINHGTPQRDRGPVAAQVAGAAGTSALARW